MLRFVLALLVTIAATTAPAAAAKPAPHPVVLKVATQIPKGSGWAKLVERAADNIDKGTQGRVQLKVYYSGVQGDEVEMARKLAAGSLDGALLSNAGLSLLDPEVSVLRLPRLFDSVAERTHVLAAVRPSLAGSLDHQGYRLVALFPVGPIHFAATRPLATLADLRATAMWINPADSIMMAFLAELKVRTVSVTFADVLTSLGSGAIDAIYGPPLTMVAMQWYKRTSVVSDQPFAFDIGGLVFTTTSLAPLSAADAQILQQVGLALERDLGRLMHKDNTRALKALGKSGLVVEAPDPGLVTELNRAAAVIQSGLAGNLYSVAILKDVLAARAQFRTQASPALAATGTSTPAKPVPAARVAIDEPQPSYTLTSKLPDAPDDVRALRTALADCTGDQFDWWIVFPLSIDGDHYSNAAELLRACRAGKLRPPTPDQLGEALDHLAITDDELALTIGGDTWHFDWRDFTWMLTAID